MCHVFIFRIFSRFVNKPILRCCCRDTVLILVYEYRNSEKNEAENGSKCDSALRTSPQSLVEIQLLEECIKRCYYATLRHPATYSCYAPATRFTNITTILRLSYDNANVTIDLRRTSYSPYKTSYERRKAFLRYDSLAKSSEIVFVNSAHCQATQQANHSQQAAAASLNVFVSVHALLKRQCYGNLCSPDQ